MNWKVKQVLNEAVLLLSLAGLLVLFVVPLLVLIMANVDVVESKWYSPAHEVVTEEGVLSVDEGWYIRQWNGSPREVSEEEWEGIVVGEKYPG